jgi:hypothetical protein
LRVRLRGVTKCSPNTRARERNPRGKRSNTDDRSW